MLKPEPPGSPHGHTSEVASTLRTPPRWLASEGAVATHTVPPACARAIGLLSSENDLSMRASAGLMRTIAPSAPSATHTAPEPRARAAGPAPVRMVLET